MSNDTQAIIDIVERLSDARRNEVVDFARSLLTQDGLSTSAVKFQQWLKTAKGAAKTGMTTDQIMALTRGDS